MRRYRVLLSALIVELLWVAAAFGQGTYKVETIGAPSSPDLPKALQNILQPQGARLANDQGAAICEVWLRKQIVTQKAASSSSDVLYGSLDEGMLIGVLHYPKEGADYRGQPIKAGYYTLRYALIPQDGNHMGVNPHRDSLLLSPAAADTQLDQELKFDDLVKLSRQSSGTPHPGFLIMSPVGGTQEFPSVVKDAQGHWNLQLKAPGQSGDLPIAITLVGKWEG